MRKRSGRLPVAVVLFVLLGLLGLCSGCGSMPVYDGEGTETGGTYLTINDDAGRLVVLPKKPERIVVLSTSYLDLLYAVGGKAVGKPASRSGKVPAEAEGLPEVGQATNVNMEKLIALQPDFVIGYQGLHEKLVPLLESSHIPVVLLRMKTYEDVQRKLLLFGEITGNLPRARSAAEDLARRIEKITAALPAQPKKVVILHATPKNVSVGLENSIAGNAARILKLTNIAGEDNFLAREADAAPYSLEKLVAGDPDIIFITVMGETGDSQKRLQDEVESNPAWAGLRAVQHKQVYFLPGDLFQLNPGLHYDEAVAYMARLVYPEVYGNAE